MDSHVSSVEPYTSQLIINEIIFIRLKKLNKENESKRDFKIRIKMKHKKNEKTKTWANGNMQQKEKLLSLDIGQIT